jgi:hypothetical protein|tara:strand:+ start:900 stop:1190 length:291 start_codon:yes stop_codon:yes gene_type:complete
MAKDGAHYPSKKFKENYNNIFKPKKINLSPKTTKKFLEEIADEEASKADQFFTKGDIAWIERDTREQFSDKDRVEENIRKMEKNNEKELSEASDNV